MVRVLCYGEARERFGAAEIRAGSFSGTLAELLKGQLNGTDIDDLMSDFIVMLNGRGVADLGGPNAQVSDGDTVSILPMAAGG